MPSSHISDHQVRLYMRLRQNNALQAAAAKAGFSTATAYRVEADPQFPSTKKKRRGRRRPDPLAGIFDEEIVPLLEQTPGLRAVALFEELMRRIRHVANVGPRDRRRAGPPRSKQKIPDSPDLSGQPSRFTPFPRKQMNVACLRAIVHGAEKKLIRR